MKTNKGKRKLPATGTEQQQQQQQPHCLAQVKVFQFILLNDGLE